MLIPEEYIIFDLETTGLSPKFAEIIEIGAVKVKNGMIVDRFRTYVDPIRPIPKMITELTGISEKQTKGAPRIEEAVALFIDFINDSVLIAHNAPFDCRFLGAVCAMTGMSITNSVLDSLCMAKAYIKDAPNHKLETLKSYLGINLPSHNAADDCVVTYNVVEYCRKKQNISV